MNSDVREILEVLAAGGLLAVAWGVGLALGTGVIVASGIWTARLLGVAL